MVKRVLLYIFFKASKFLENLSLMRQERKSKVKGYN